MIVYKITNKINNRIYIGQTSKSAEQRLKKHISEAKCESTGKRKNNYFHNAIIKYGADNFYIEVIDSADSKDEIFKKEDYWIKKLNSTDSSIGYNLMIGGQSGEKGDRTKEKLREKKIENWKDPDLSERMYDGLKKATEEWKKVSLDRRVTCICQACGKQFSIQACEAKKRKYCSLKCANSINNKTALESAKIKNHDIRISRDKDAYEFAVKWAIKNKYLINHCSLNKISTTLNELQELMFVNFNIYDWRTISAVICGNGSKKKMLFELQKIVKRYAVPDWN